MGKGSKAKAASKSAKRKGKSKGKRDPDEGWCVREGRGAVAPEGDA